MKTRSSRFLKCLTPWFACGLTWALMTHGGFAQAEKIQLSEPEKGRDVPTAKGLNRKRSNSGVEIFDRNSSMSGAVDAPSVSPSETSGRKLDAKTERKIIDALDREKNWSLKDEKDLDAKPGSEKDLDQVGEDNSDSPTERSLLMKRLQGRKEESPDRDNRGNNPRRPSSGDPRNPNPTVNPNSNPTSKLIPGDPGVAAKRDKAGAPTLNEKIQVSDPWSVPSGARRSSDVGGGFGKGFQSDPAANATKSAAAAVAVSDAELNRNRQFQDLLAGEKKEGVSFGTFSRSSAERQNQFREILKDSRQPIADVSRGAGAAGVPGVGGSGFAPTTTPGVGLPPASTLVRPSLPEITGSGVGGGGFAAPSFIPSGVPKTVAPTFSPRPIILPQPTRY